jgi:hypothetical protein
MLDIKQKLKLVAIEEEITKLQLQICRGDSMYLGAKNDEVKSAEATKYFEDVQKQKEPYKLKRQCWRKH